MKAKELSATRKEVPAIFQVGLPIAGANLADGYKAVMECFE